MSRGLVFTGVLVVLLGLLWPHLRKIGLGKLPGDIAVEKGKVRFYFPMTSAIIIIFLLNLFFWFINK